MHTIESQLPALLTLGLYVNDSAGTAYVIHIAGKLHDWSFLSPLGLCTVGFGKVTHSLTGARHTLELKGDIQTDYEADYSALPSCCPTDAGLALAVLRGDKAAALMLADKVLESYHAKPA